MSEVGIFIAGVMVSLAVTTALAILIWAAIQDGRIQKAFEEGRPNPLDDAPTQAPQERVGP